MIADIFVVEIHLGDDAMQTYGNVSAAMQRVAMNFAGAEQHPKHGDEGKIYDANGNLVGHWRATLAPTTPGTRGR